MRGDEGRALSMLPDLKAVSSIVASSAGGAPKLEQPWRLGLIPPRSSNGTGWMPIDDVEIAFNATSSEGGAPKPEHPCKLGRSPAKQRRGTYQWVSDWQNLWEERRLDRNSNSRSTFSSSSRTAPKAEQPCRLGGKPARHSRGTMPKLLLLLRDEPRTPCGIDFGLLGALRGGLGRDCCRISMAVVSSAGGAPKAEQPCKLGRNPTRRKRGMDRREDRKILKP